MLYRFNLELSDIDRGVYTTLNFRIAQHPSETAPYLLTRILAYALSYRDGLEFTPEGLNDPEAPALRALGARGGIDLWIEIGNPSQKKLHKASKAAISVVIYTYKSAEVLVKEIQASEVHRSDTIKIYAFDSLFLQALEKEIKKNNSWSILLQQGQIDVNTGNQTVTSEVQSFQFK